MSADRPYVLITHGPGDIVITAYLMRPGQDRLWIASNTVPSIVRHKAFEVAHKEHVQVVEDPAFVALPPLEPKWFRPASNRLLMEIPSVPELRTYLDECLAYFLLFGEGGHGECQASRAVADAEQALQDAQWRIACASWRWVRRIDVPPDGQHSHWEALRLVEVWRYRGVIPGPSKRVAVRYSGAVA